MNGPEQSATAPRLLCHSCLSRGKLNTLLYDPRCARFVCVVSHYGPLPRETRDHHWPAPHGPQLTEEALASIDAQPTPSHPRRG